MVTPSPESSRPLQTPGVRSAGMAEGVLAGPAHILIPEAGVAPLGLSTVVQGFASEMV